MRIATRIALLSILLIAGASTADNINDGGNVGLVRTLSARTLGQLGVNLGAALKYDRDYGYVGSVMSADGSTIERSSPQMFSGDIFAAVGLTRFWDFGLALPLYYDITGWDDVTRAGVGDLEVSTKLALPIRRTGTVFGQALFFRLIIPTGSYNRGYFPRHLYNSDDNMFSAGDLLVNPELVWSLHFDELWSKVPIQLHANIGAIITDTKNQSVLTGAIGLEVSPVSWLTVFGEVSGEARVADYSESFSVRHFENGQLVVSPGVRITTPVGMYATIAGDIGISSDADQYRTGHSINGYSYETSPTPTYGAQITLGWARKGRVKVIDSDSDGVADKHDACIYAAEDKDGFEDADGCPDIDNDGDGMLDARDSCPNEAAQYSGCPVYDADNDGLRDNVDKCPQQAEDVDGFEDADGCPDLDNDKDGVPDASDRCPANQEDLDGFEDGDGCPDMDNDRDGIADEWDKCRDVRGSAENSGCPKTQEIQRGALRLKGVTFQSGKAILNRNSYTVLDLIYESLAEWPEVKLEIQGHTDSQGNDAANLKLSQSRADAVRAYLVKKGVDPNRLTATGYGETRPLADNAIPAGREENRRVELHRTD